MDINNTLKTYLNELSSNSPTPGGGNVSALCAVLASCLGEMVCNLTIGKKKYSDVEQDIIQIKKELEVYKENFIKLSIEDNKAFDKVMDAFRLPKETDAEKEVRSQKIEEATIYAAEVPAKLIIMCKDALPLIEQIINKGNQNSLSDAGVAALLLSTAAQGAYLNVLINCSSLKNQITAGEILKRSETLTNEIKIVSNNVIENITKKLTI